MVRFLGINLGAQQFLDAFDARWGHLLPVQELILEGRYGSLAACPITTAWASSLYPANLQQYLGKAGTWGRKPKRVRIDYIPLVKLQTKCLSDPLHSNLKILMLQPLGKGIDEVKLKDYEKISEPECYNLARSILQNSLPGLQLIVIRSHWYWLSRECDGNHSRGHVWRWNDAKLDSAQADVIRASLKLADWTFLESTTVPYWDQKVLEAWAIHRRPYEFSSPFGELYQMWNHFTAVRVHESRSPKVQES